ncbi:MAG: sigma-70 family RNA polymerase sigma factor [Aureliella sp.]
MTTADPNSSVPAEHPTLSSMLLDGVRNMDPSGWSRLVTTFGPIVYRWCRSSGVKESDAPDVVQEVFASVARGIATFQREKPQGSFRSWLATITRNKVRDHYRSLAKSPNAAGGTEAFASFQQVPEHLDSTICAESAETPVVREVLRQVQAEFEAPTWNAFWMATIEGKKAAEIAGDLGISTASVYQAKSRVLRRLRQRLAELP